MEENIETENEPFALHWKSNSLKANDEDRKVDKFLLVSRECRLVQILSFSISHSLCSFFSRPSWLHCFGNANKPMMKWIQRIQRHLYIFPTFIFQTFHLLVDKFWHHSPNDVLLLTLPSLCIYGIFPGKQVLRTLLTSCREILRKKTFFLTLAAVSFLSITCRPPLFDRT